MAQEKEWQPVTKLGRLVKAGKITSMEQIYLHSLPIKEFQIVDFFLPKLKDEVMKVRNDFFHLSILEETVYDLLLEEFAHFRQLEEYEIDKENLGD